MRVQEEETGSEKKCLVTTAIALEQNAGVSVCWGEKNKDLPSFKKRKKKKEKSLESAGSCCGLLMDLNYAFYPQDVSAGIEFCRRL